MVHPLVGGSQFFDFAGDHSHTDLLHCKVTLNHSIIFIYLIKNLLFNYGNLINYCKSSNTAAPGTLFFQPSSERGVILKGGYKRRRAIIERGGVLRDLR